MTPAWQVPRMGMQQAPNMFAMQQPWQAPNMFAQPMRAAARAVPEMTPEEKKSLLSRVMSGVEYVGNTLGKPSAAAQGLMYGMAGGTGPQAGASALKNLIPFSDTFGITDPKNRIYGRDTTSQFGWTGKNKPGMGIHGWNPTNWDWQELGSDVGSFGFEVATDPLLYLAGPLGATKKGVEGIAKGTAIAAKELQALGKTDDVVRAAGKFLEQVVGKSKPAQRTLGTTPLSIAKDFKSGERSLAGLRLPWQRTPFATVHDIPTVGPAIDKAVGKAVETAAYHPLLGKPLQAARYVLSPAAGSIPLKMHRERDMWYATLQANRDKMVDMLPTYAKGYKQLQTRFDDIAAHHSAAGDAAGFTDFLRIQRETKAGLPDPDQINQAMKGYMGLSADAPLEQITGDAETFGKAMHGWMDAESNMVNTLYDIERGLGGKGEMLDDPFIAHAVRRTGHPGVVSERAKKDLIARERQSAYRAMPRNKYTRNIPGGTHTLNDMAKDAMFDEPVDAVRAALAHGVLDEKAKNADVWTAYVTETYLKPRLEADIASGVITREAGQKVMDEHWYTPVQKMVSKKGKTTVEEGATRAEGLGQWMRQMPKVVRKEGLYGRSYLEDTTNAAGSMLDRISTLQTAHAMLRQKGVVTIGGDGPQLAKAWRKAGFRVGEEAGDKSTGLYKFLHANFTPEQIGDKPGEFLMSLRMRPGGDGVLKAFAQIMVPEEAKGILKMVDQVTGLWKGWQTTPWPAFHTRNWGSGYWQALTDGYVSPRELAKAHWDIGKRYKGKVWGGKAVDTDKLDFAEVIESLGLMEGHGRAVETAGKVAAEQMASDTRGIKEAVKHSGWHNLNPFAMRGGWGQPTAEQFAKGALPKQHLVAEIGDRMYNMVETMNRGGYALALLRKGFSPARVKHLVTRSQFDYSALSPIFKSHIRRAVPFATWMFKNVPYQFTKLLERPGGMAAQTIRAFNQATRSEDGYTPAFLREGVGMRVPWDPGTREAAHHIRQVGLPFEDLNRFAFSGGMPDIGRTVEKGLGNLHFGALAGLESLAGKQFYSGRDIKDLEPLGGSAAAGRAAAYSPASRAIRTARNWLDERKGWEQKLLNSTTGLHTGTYDLDKLELIDMQNATKRELEGQDIVREGSYYVVPKRYRDQEHYPETQEKIRQLSRLGRAIQKLTQKRDAEAEKAEKE